ncbi:oxygen-independent coproporphyrinogen III oxidase [Neolewinella maritima]|uniref:coproporphyrinogen III oxidase n=1 Tax=Neolewinella maritima TaxID=1383882 RepID=UPI001EE7B1D8|nr:coproporphyrinogen III oxidase [Neolewinella maritima]
MTSLEQYHRPAPRYTSYPSIPHWQARAPTPVQWLAALNRRMASSRDTALCVHLPCDQHREAVHPYTHTVLSELDLYCKALHLRPRLTQLHLGGGTPTFPSPDALLHLIDGILTRVDLAREVSFSFEAQPGRTTAAHLTTLASRGFGRMHIRVRDFFAQTVPTAEQQQSATAVGRTTRTARALGYAVVYELEYGPPAWFAVDTLRWICDLRPDRIVQISSGHGKCTEPELPRRRAQRDPCHTGRRLLEEAGYHAIGADHFALADDPLVHASRGGSLHRSVMGYTSIRATLTLALGCAAIGDSGNTYVQNEHRVAPYQRAVLEDGRLPIAKGHILSAEEQIVRRHILNLLCRGHTQWRAPELRCAAVERATDLWNEMAVDGLLRRSPYRIDVGPRGRPFLHTICLPLDDHYWAQQH